MANSLQSLVMLVCKQLTIQLLLEWGGQYEGNRCVIVQHPSIFICINLARHCACVFMYLERCKHMCSCSEKYVLESTSSMSHGGTSTARLNERSARAQCRHDTTQRISLRTFEAQLHLLGIDVADLLKYSCTAG